ncbi:MAG: hypothetical protein QNJ97_05970 [Myxococcota bacterium]|nr:hypothetical protein [Myxococcota bacterium]
MNAIKERRAFLKELAAFTGGMAIAPMVVSCGGGQKGAIPPAKPDEVKPPVTVDTKGSDPDAIPLVQPVDWDPLVFNRKRGNAGAIPASYHADINGPDGVNKHLGKHLPYIPELPEGLVPNGYLPLMWGNPELGYARHPNAPKGDPAYPEGHWYNWVLVRKAVDQDVEEVHSQFTSWPEPGDDQSGQFAVFGGGDITADSGKNTVYLVALPKDVTKGDLIRVYGHCLYHGEYVDFVTI